MEDKHYLKKKMKHLHYLSGTNEPIKIIIQNKHNKYSQTYKGRYWEKWAGIKTMGIRKTIIVEIEFKGLVE